MDYFPFFSEREDKVERFLLSYYRGCIESLFDA